MYLAEFSTNVFNFISFSLSLVYKTFFGINYFRYPLSRSSDKTRLVEGIRATTINPKRTFTIKLFTIFGILKK